MSETLRVLTIAREYVAKGWTRDYMARTASDEPTKATAPDAAKWCALGAVRRAAAEVSNNIYGTYWPEERLSFCVPARHGSSVANYNDDPFTKKEDILKMFDCAIETERKVLAELGNIRTTPTDDTDAIAKGLED